MRLFDQELGPGVPADDPVDRQAVVALEGLHGGLGSGSEDPVRSGLSAVHAAADQEQLQRSHGSATVSPAHLLRFDRYGLRIGWPGHGHDQRLLAGPAHDGAAIVVAGRRGVPLDAGDRVAVVLLDEPDVIRGGVLIELE